MTKGIVLFAFGRRGYAYMAYNLAMSIKYFNENISITLYIDDKISQYINFEPFDQVISLPAYYIYSEKVGIDPAKVKVNIPNFLPYDENLYLDVDGLAVKDLQPLIEALSKEKGCYLTQSLSMSNFDGYDTASYNIWSTKEKIWDFFDLNKESILPAVQTSFAYFKKGDDLKDFYVILKTYFDKGFNRADITQRWGGTLPDELFYSGACAHLNYDPSSKQNPIFFGNKENIHYKDQDIIDQHYILAIYGNGRGNTLTRKRFFDLYDAKLKTIVGSGTYYPTKYLMIDKHANF